MILVVIKDDSVASALQLSSDVIEADCGSRRQTGDDRRLSDEFNYLSSTSPATAAEVVITSSRPAIFQTSSSAAACLGSDVL